LRSKVCTRSYAPSKLQESQLLQFRDKKPFGCGPVERHKVYYKGEGGGFPQVRAVVSLVCPCCPWFVLAPKVFQLCTNHLVWVMCRPMWVSEACQLFLVPSRSSNTPLYPSKCCELGSVPRLLPLPLFSTWTYVWVLWGVGSALSEMHPPIAKLVKRLLITIAPCSLNESILVRWGFQLVTISWRRYPLIHLQSWMGSCGSLSFVLLKGEE
jgi:hypothetical protein